MRTTEAGKAARSRAAKINLQEITNFWRVPSTKYAPTWASGATVLHCMSALLVARL